VHCLAEVRPGQRQQHVNKELLTFHLPIGVEESHKSVSSSLKDLQDGELTFGGHSKAISEVGRGRGRSTKKHNSVSTQMNDGGTQVWGVGSFEPVPQLK
jgi:hypothetical protein